jgi:soluble lytic murein transglycosylase-like protein
MKITIMLLFFVYSTIGNAHLNESFKNNAKTVAQVCELYNIDYTIISKQIQVESSYDRLAVGARGEIGYLQLKPTTASEVRNRKVLVEELRDSLFNVESAILYLKHLSRFFKHLGFEGKDLDIVTWASYNEGPGNTIKRHFSKKIANKLCREFRRYAEDNVIPNSVKVVEAKHTKYTRKIFLLGIIKER